MGRDLPSNRHRTRAHREPDSALAVQMVTLTMFDMLDLIVLRSI